MYKIEKRRRSFKPMNLSKYKLPLEALPKKANEIIQQKVYESEFIDSNNCSLLIEDEDIGDGIYKNKEKSYFKVHYKYGECRS